MIDRDEAVRLARVEVERRGLPWAGPVSVRGGPFAFRVWTMSGSRGGNVVVRVNRRSGAAVVVTVIPK